MSYLTQNTIANNPSMVARMAQAAAQEGIDSDPDRWVWERRRQWAAAPGWDAAWESAMVLHPPDDDPLTPPYDPGADETVITDGMILAQVQLMATPAGPP
jgi:hypothetical protein